MKTAEEFLQSKDIWNHPMVSDRTESKGYEVEHLLEEYAREKAISVLKEAAEKIDKEYRDNDTNLKDGYTSGYCYALDKAEQLVKPLIKDQ